LNDQPLKQEHSISAIKGLEGDLEIIIDQVWNDLQGLVSRTAVQKALLEVIPEYENATVPTFVPIFVRRDAGDLLRATLVQAEGESMTKRGPLPERTVVGPSPRGLKRLRRRLESLLVQLR
jgi:hypothetical protein